MSTGRRYTSEELTSMADEFRGFNYPTHWPQLVAMLDQTAETEAQVMGLVEAALPALMILKHFNEKHEIVIDLEKALSKFRCEA